MIRLDLKSLMDRDNISRYKFQQLTNWNYKRINALYFNKAKYITIEEIDKITDIFKCLPGEIIKKKEQ